jgi:predicted phosphodiesterase
VWHGPPVDASAEELQATFGALQRPLAVYGHIHRPYVRELPGLTVANSGCVSQPFDDDLRAAYLLVTDGRPEIRRVEYDLARELEALQDSPLPHADWLMRILVRGPGELPAPQPDRPVK